jgi:hypothetical protein
MIPAAFAGVFKMTFLSQQSFLFAPEIACKLAIYFRNWLLNFPLLSELAFR